MDDLISRKVAINTIMSQLPEPHYPSWYAEQIKALPTVYVPDMNAGDMISRDAATAAIYKLCNDFDTDNPHIDAIIDILDNLPPVQPERIKGHWIEITSRNHTYKCSVCGRLLVNITDGKNNVAKNYPYCHCGADMRGEADG